MSNKIKYLHILGIALSFFIHLTVADGVFAQTFNSGNTASHSPYQQRCTLQPGHNPYAQGHSYGQNHWAGQGTSIQNIKNLFLAFFQTNLVGGQTGGYHPSQPPKCNYFNCVTCSTGEKKVCNTNGCHCVAVHTCPAGSVKYWDYTSHTYKCRQDNPTCECPVSQTTCSQGYRLVTRSQAIHCSGYTKSCSVRVCTPHYGHGGGNSANVNNNILVNQNTNQNQNLNQIAIGNRVGSSASAYSYSNNNGVVRINGQLI